MRRIKYLSDGRESETGLRTLNTQIRKSDEQRVLLSQETDESSSLQQLIMKSNSS